MSLVLEFFSVCIKINFNFNEISVTMSLFSSSQSLQHKVKVNFFIFAPLIIYIPFKLTIKD